MLQENKNAYSHSHVETKPLQSSFSLIYFLQYVLVFKIQLTFLIQWINSNIEKSQLLCMPPEATWFFPIKIDQARDFKNPCKDHLVVGSPLNTINLTPSSKNIDYLVAHQTLRSWFSPPLIDILNTFDHIVSSKMM